MFRNGCENRCETQRRLVVVQQSGFQELIDSHRAIGPTAPTRRVRKARVCLCEPSARNNQRQARLIWRGGVQPSLAASLAARTLQVSGWRGPLLPPSNTIACAPGSKAAGQPTPDLAENPSLRDACFGQRPLAPKSAMRNTVPGRKAHVQIFAFLGRRAMFNVSRSTGLYFLLLCGGLLPTSQAHAFDLNGAWATVADQCSKIFIKKGDKISFAPFSEEFGRGFVAD